MTDVLRSLVRKISFNNSDNLQLKHKTSIQSNTALEKKKRKPDTIKKVSDVQVHHTVPNFNNSSEYINDIENLIISKLIDGGKEGIAVDHIEHANISDSKTDGKVANKHENISSKLSKEKVEKMINFDYRYIKTKERTSMYNYFLCSCQWRNVSFVTTGYRDTKKNNEKKKRECKIKIYEIASLILETCLRNIRKHSGTFFHITSTTIFYGNHIIY
ncbi:CBM_collapsed_G0010860.mRNA.1.CDS.1 [Saccharomyces cerevisiae]|nr:CBM_collapsed_G0010860.mRNA.1.CDS.1 [Saccharomyces cerevisiae]